MGFPPSSTGKCITAPEERRAFCKRMGATATDSSVETPYTFEKFCGDKGCDISVAAKWVYNLKPLRDRFGNDPRLVLHLFIVDETSYSRALTTLAGHYPSLKLGPPWWCNDSRLGTRN